MMPERRRAGPCSAMDDRGRLIGLIYDALRARFHAIKIGKDRDCPTCGTRGPTKAG